MGSSHVRTDRARALLEQVFELTARLSEGMEREVAAQGLTTARAELLWRLHATGPQTQRKLSEALRCTPRNVTGLVDALEAAQLVRREPHPSDGRATLVTLTDAGDRTLADWAGRYEHLAERLFAGLAADDLERLEATLTTILDRLRDVLPLRR